MKYKKRSQQCLQDILPYQDHYYLLSNGVNYARHGTGNDIGVLIFTNLERAEQFRMTVGANLDFEPCKVSFGEFMAEVWRVGAFTVTKGNEVMVCKMSDNL